VDCLAVNIEAVLPQRDTCFGYRQALSATPNPYEGSPVWSNFASAIDLLLEGHPHGYCLQADISGYFLSIQPAELARKLLEAGAAGTVVRDLEEMLVIWNTLGVRGIPQGVQPSSALGNLYLRPLDTLLESEGVPYARYMDDFWVFTDSFSEARRVQDAIERLLYSQGLTLSGDKSSIKRTATVLDERRQVSGLLEERREAVRMGVAAMAGDEYSDPESLPDPSEVDVIADLALHGEIIDAVRADNYPPHFRRTLIRLYRELRSVRNPGALTEVPMIVLRFPDLTFDAMTYAAACSSVAARPVADVFDVVLDDNRFIRELEILHVLKAAMACEVGVLADLAGRLAQIALSHRDPLVRARAILAWGMHSATDDFVTADDFWATARRDWRAYPFVAIQDKTRTGREDRFKAWSQSGRSLDRLAASLRAERLGWNKI